MLIYRASKNTFYKYLNNKRTVVISSMIIFFLLWNFLLWNTLYIELMLMFLWHPLDVINDPVHGSLFLSSSCLFSSFHFWSLPIGGQSLPLFSDLPSLTHIWTSHGYLFQVTIGLWFSFPNFSYIPMTVLFLRFNVFKMLVLFKYFVFVFGCLKYLAPFCLFCLPPYL